MRRVFCVLLTIILLMASISVQAEATGFDVSAFLTRLMAGDDMADIYAQMTPEMQSALSAQDLAGIWAQLAAVGGAFEGFACEPAVTQNGEYTVLVQQMNMQNIGLQCTVSLDGQGRIAGLSFTPCAKVTVVQTPASDREEDVWVGQEPWRLPGTLTMPEASAEPVPAVVLVHGSGPSDRDESVGATKLFRDLASYLSQKGIAVLRYDKRTYAYGKEIAASADYVRLTAEEETIQDAIAAGRLLAADERIDPQRIYVVGHSLGAMLSPRIVSESDGLFAGMALLCGTNATLLDIMIRQNEDAIAALPEEQRAAYDAMLDEARQQADALTGLTAEEAVAMTILGQPGYYFWEMAQAPTAAELIQQLALPTLIINGERDFQVNTHEGRDGWAQALDLEAPYMTCLWADVNHVLMRPQVDESAAGTVAEYYVECTLDEDVAQVISTFILTNGGSMQ